MGQTGQQVSGKKTQSSSGHGSGSQLSLVHNDLPSMQALWEGGGGREGGKGTRTLERQQCDESVVIPACTYDAHICVRAILVWLHHIPCAARAIEVGELLCTVLDFFATG